MFVCRSARARACPGVDVVVCPASWGTCSLKTWRQPVGISGEVRPRFPPRSFQRSRMERHLTVNQDDEGSIPSAGASVPCALDGRAPALRREDRFDSGRGPGPPSSKSGCAPQARDAGCKSRRGYRAVSWLSNSVRLKSGRAWCDSTAAHRRALAPFMVTLLVWDEGGM